MVLQLSEAYSILGVSADTSIEEVKKVYKRLALKTHPDKNPNDPDAHKKFLKISEAYKRISDPSAFEDEMDDLPNEEEMEAMFEMMFAEMMGMGGMGMHEISPEMFAAMEEMMMNGVEDDEILASMMFGGHGSFDSSDDDGEHYGDDELLEMLMHELMRPGKMKRGKSSKSSKSGRFTGMSRSFRGQGAKQSKDSGDEDSDEWSTESDSEEESPPRGGRKQGGANPVRSPMSITGKSSKLKGANMERTGSVRMGEGSRRVPPRMSSFKAGKSSRTLSKDADAKQHTPNARPHVDSGDEKYEFSLRSAEAKASSQARRARRARDQAETDAKAAQQLQTELVVGDRVLVQDRMLGAVAYVGNVHYAKGVYVGVVMDQAQDGKNTGTVKGTEYFKCPAGKKALVVPLSDVFKV